MKPLLISSGEPAGIGPDICLALANYQLPIVVLGDINVLKQRAHELNQVIEFVEYHPERPVDSRRSTLTVYSIPVTVPVISTQLDPQNADYVIQMLTLAVSSCLKGEFTALVTAPINKEVINRAGIAFTGHTEFLADYCGSNQVVMMLACEAMKVALVTTHLPLNAVPNAITAILIRSVIKQLHAGLQQDFGVVEPSIYVSGLNPHAGEGGYLGREEIDIIIPALKSLQQEGIHVHGPFPADTLFCAKNRDQVDAFVTMYHDQGLPVLKYAGFSKAVNITLGLPIIRTSVDHGTAIDLAGTGQADHGSLLAAVNTAISMVKMRAAYDQN